MGYIYKITNKINGKAYIGQSINNPIGTNGRINQHLKGHSKNCRALHNAIKKYGKEHFSVEILHIVLLPDILDELERAEIRNHNTITPNGYNLTSGGENKKLISLETRKKISNSKKGRPSHRKGATLSDETRQKISENSKGKKHSLETRQKMAAAHKRRIQDPKGKKQVDDALKLGRKKGAKRSPETRKRMSEAHTGLKRSLEHRKNISTGNKRRYQNAEERKKNIRSTKD